MSDTRQYPTELPDGLTMEEMIAFGAATMHEAAGRIGALPSALRPMTTTPSVAGPAVTVCGPPGDNLWLHRAVYRCRPGDVLVASVSGAYDWGYWGEILSYAARERDVGAVVIDGCVRDLDRLEEVGVPVFARGVAIRGTDKCADGVGAINDPLVIGSVVIKPGDWIFGDQDGLVAIPADLLSVAIKKAQERLEKEQHLMSELRAGKRTLELLHLPQE